MTFYDLRQPTAWGQKWVLYFPRIVAVGWWSLLAAFQYSGSAIVDHQYVLVSAPAVQMSFSHVRMTGAMRI